MSHPLASRQEALQRIRHDTGAFIVCLVDVSTGMLLEASTDLQGRARPDLDIVAVGCTDVVRSQQNLVAALAGTAAVDDILVMVGDQFHVYHLVPQQPGLVVWAAVDREHNSLAQTRFTIERLCRTLLGPDPDPAVSG